MKLKSLALVLLLTGCKDHKPEQALTFENSIAIATNAPNPSFQGVEISFTNYPAEYFHFCFFGLSTTNPTGWIKVDGHSNHVIQFTFPKP